MVGEGKDRKRLEKTRKDLQLGKEKKTCSLGEVVIQSGKLLAPGAPL